MEIISYVYIEKINHDHAHCSCVFQSKPAVQFTSVNMRAPAVASAQHQQQQATSPSCFYTQTCKSPATGTYSAEHCVSFLLLPVLILPNHADSLSAIFQFIFCLRIFLHFFNKKLKSSVATKQMATETRDNFIHSACRT